MSSEEKIWQIWVDTGGTFTDCIAIDPHGKILKSKVLSHSCIRVKAVEKVNSSVLKVSVGAELQNLSLENFYIRALNSPDLHRKIISFHPDTNVVKLDANLGFDTGDILELFTGEEAPILACRCVTSTPPSQPLPQLTMKLGFTKGTNALLESRGANAVFVCTKGFKDLLYIGNQQRPNLFQLDIPEPSLLYDSVVEVEERIDSDGEVILPLLDNEIERLVEKIKKKDAESVVISLLNSFKNPIHEIKLAEALASQTSIYTCFGSQLSHNIKYLDRSSTGMVNAYLEPIVKSYIDNISSCLSEDSSLHLINSFGALETADHFYSKDSLLSGPAAGVMGAKFLSAKYDRTKIISFDMGGTSTDAAIIDEFPMYSSTLRISGQSLHLNTIDIETVAAGGGSICSFKNGKLTVGPESASAYPGPACYGAGGPLTITDLNLLLGRLDPSALNIPLNIELSKKALEDLVKKISIETGQNLKMTEVVSGLIQIADEIMAAAIRKKTVSQGIAPDKFTLMCYGGAGGMHACGIAELVGIDEIAIPFDAGLLSAYGLGKTSHEQIEEQTVLKDLNQFNDLHSVINDLEQRAISSLLAKTGLKEEDVFIRVRSLFLRLHDQSNSLEISYVPKADLEANFKQKYLSNFGYWPENHAIEIEKLRVISSTLLPTEKSDDTRASKQNAAKDYSIEVPLARSAKMPVYQWENLKPGDQIDGPGLLINPYATIYIAEHWSFILDNKEIGFAKRINPSNREPSTSNTLADLSLFINRFKMVAEEMGAQLERTAFSVNVKERLDFSCGILDRNGFLVANAALISAIFSSTDLEGKGASSNIFLIESQSAVLSLIKYMG